MVRYDWLIIEKNGNGVNLNCDRKRANSREIELKNKEKCSKPDIIELMAIRFCMSNIVSLQSYYYLPGVNY